MADDIRALSAALAHDPGSLRYVDLAEALRRRGQPADALQVALHGLGRHPEHADGYDCLARIHTDRGELLEARLAWERALTIVPEHAGALKGVGFLYYRQGDRKRAVDALEHAIAANPDDEAARRALEMIQGGRQSTGGTGGRGDRDSDARRTTHDASRTTHDAPSHASPDDVPQLRATAAALRTAQLAAASLDADAAAARDAAVRAATAAESTPPAPAPALPPVFTGLEGATSDILLLDGRGLVMAGGLKSAEGDDVSELAAAALAGVSGEASRTAGYLNLGAWSAIVAETEHANVVLSPVGESALLMLRRDRSTPVGLAVRIAERAKAAAARWLEIQAP